MTILRCEQCNSDAVDIYILPDGQSVILCDKHARGLFCLGCGAFIGGTESIFIYGAHQCELCYEDEERDIYEDDYEEAD